MLARILPPSGPTSGLESLLARLRADVERLSVPRHIWQQPEANAQTREHLAERLRALGYRVHEQGEHRNLVALPPSLPAKRMPVPALAAHYDSVAATPGADDNASALAVLLELARRCAEARRPLVVLAFNGEEEQMLGSGEFVAGYEILGQRHGFELEVVHVLEMVGFTGERQSLPPAGEELLKSAGLELPERGDFVLLAANGDSRPMLEQILAAAGRDGTLTPALLALCLPPGGEQLLPDITRSDHAPFWRAGLPAMMWTDTAELRNPNYHAPSDTPDTLDYAFMARVCGLLAATLGLDSTTC
jgi:hypothetical protein